MQIRLAIVTDIPSLVSLVQSSATAVHWSAERFEQAIRLSAPHRVLLVAEDNGELRGLLAAVQVGREWEVENLVVSVETLRHGWGTQLMLEFFARARQENAGSVFLEARESNTAARRLYEKLGFQLSGRRRRYYANPEEDALVYSLALT